VGGHHTVAEEFGCGQVGYPGTDIVILVNLVATDHPADTMWYHFLWAVGADNAQVSGFVANWESTDQDEKQSAGARGD